MKLLFVNNNMHMGGVQKALCNLLWQIYDKHDITLVLFQKKGILLEQLPPSIRVEEVKSDYRYLGSRREKGNMRKRNTYAVLARFLGRRSVVALMKHTQEEICGYDAAISYLHNGREKAFYGGCNDFVLNHVRGRKIAFIHGDLTCCGDIDKKDYGGFDCIAACSKGCGRSLKTVVPFANYLVLPNCHDFDKVKRMAEQETVLLDTGKIHVLTVARLAPEKALLRAVEALADSGRKDICYHIIGEGKQKNKLKQLIQKEAVSEQVILHGEMKNPYPWMKRADVLLIPSYHEAAPLVIGEAACLGTPILSTETCSAKEMVEQPGIGWVCGNKKEALMSAFSSLSIEKLKEKREELKALSFSDQEAVSAFERMLEEVCGNA